jgi:hypothetical protein
MTDVQLKVLESAAYLGNTGFLSLAFCIDTILIEIPALPQQDYLQLFHGAIQEELGRVARECRVEDIPLAMTDFEPHMLDLMKQGLELLVEFQKQDWNCLSYPLSNANSPANFSLPVPALLARRREPNGFFGEKVTHTRLQSASFSISMTFATLQALGRWTPIRDCPGRFVLRGVSPTLSLRELLGPDVAIQEYQSPLARDPIFVAALADGGVISYARMDGTWVHTLGTAEGFRRKLAQLQLTL